MAKTQSLESVARRLSEGCVTSPDECAVGVLKRAIVGWGKMSAVARVRLGWGDAAAWRC